MMKSKEKAIWVIKLPSRIKLLVEVGEMVEAGQKLAEFGSHTVETFDFSGDLSAMSESMREDLNNIFSNKLVKQGDAFYQVGIFKNKICFPLTGICLGLDEFKNLRIEKVEDEKKEILAPIAAKIAKIEEGKMVLEFKAKEYEGKGLNELKAWGEGEVKVVNDIKSLNYELDGGVLCTDNLNKAFLLKAIVVGIRAIIVSPESKDIKDINVDVPVLRLEEHEWKEFLKDNLNKTRKILVNAKMDKLLLVLE